MCVCNAVEILADFEAKPCTVLTNVFNSPSVVPADSESWRQQARPTPLQLSAHHWPLLTLPSPLNLQAPPLLPSPPWPWVWVCRHSWAKWYWGRSSTILSQAAVKFLLLLQFSYVYCSLFVCVCVCVCVCVYVCMCEGVCIT